ncbi:MAG: 4Fe-4S dicluster domain-containing protein [Clostridia bacterium]|nr:MAG: 4Fe-4S dicluster domain-containing protein [Clostridia bacterium]
MARYGMVIDLDRCMGCRACMEACKIENNTPQGIFWMRVFRFEEGEYPDVRYRFLPRPCMHCDNPPCTKVCPTGARYKREDGLVATDWEKCIGTRYCHAACPYGANYFNWKEPQKNYYLDWSAAPELASVTGGMVPPYKNPDLEVPYGKEGRRIAGGGHRLRVIEKCTFCVHRVEKGILPACAANCPVAAIHFGDLDDPESEVAKLLRERNPLRLREEFGTSPKVYYLSKSGPPTAKSREIEKVGAR